MKRTGFPPEKAGAVEVASSTNGQLTPPVMGAAAFLIAEFTGISTPRSSSTHWCRRWCQLYRAGLHRAPGGLQAEPAGACRSRRRRMTVRGEADRRAVRLHRRGPARHRRLLRPGLGQGRRFRNRPLIYIVAVLCACGLSGPAGDRLALSGPAGRRPGRADHRELPRAGATLVTGLYFLLPIVLLLWCILPTPNGCRRISRRSMRLHGDDRRSP